MKRSKAWADLERTAAKALGGKRILRGDDWSASLPDVDLPDLPHWKVDCKYSKAAPWRHHGYVEGIAKKYCQQPGEVPVLVTKTGNQAGAYVTMRLEDFAAVLTALRGARDLALEGEP